MDKRSLTVVAGVEKTKEHAETTKDKSQKKKKKKKKKKDTNTLL